MAPGTAALILASAFLHALWNALLKRQADPEAAAVALLAVATAAAGAAVPWSAGVAFPGAAGLLWAGAAGLCEAGSVWAGAAGLCEAGYFATLALAFRTAPLGVAYAIARGGALALVWPASITLLGERVTGTGVAGVVAVAGGLSLLAVERVAGLTARGLGWAALCAAFVAGYHLCYKLALSAGGEPTAVLAVAFALALPLVAARLGRGGVARAAAALRGQPVVVSGAGLLCAASFLIFLVALARGGAGAAATLRNTSVLFALLLGWAIGERPTRRQVIGMVAVAVGAVLMGAGQA